VVSKETEKGPDVSVSTVVQLAAPAGERWKATETTPAPESVAAPESVTLARRFAAGASRLTAGAVLSTPTVSDAEVVELPARSVVTARRS
jgi:hypothetical protein